MIGAGFLVRIGQLIVAIVVLALIAMVLWGLVLGVVVVLGEVFGFQTKSFVAWMLGKIPHRKKKLKKHIS
jgi:hypothetical protein